MWQASFEPQNMGWLTSAFIPGFRVQWKRLGRVSCNSTCGHVGTQQVQMHRKM